MELFDLTSHQDWQKFRAGVLASLPSDVALHIIGSVEKLRTDYNTLHRNAIIFAAKHMTSGEWQSALTEIADELTPTPPTESEGDR